MLNQSCHWCDTNISVSQFWSKTWDSSQGYPASHSWGENVDHLYQTFRPELTSNIPSLYPSPDDKGKEDLVSIGVNAVKLEVLHQASLNDGLGKCVNQPLAREEGWWLLAWIITLALVNVTVWSDFSKSATHMNLQPRPWILDFLVCTANVIRSTRTHKNSNLSKWARSQIPGS